MYRGKKVTCPQEDRIEPFRIVGGVYFVGTYRASSHLIDTGDGLILIDSGYSETLYLVIDSIHRAGFDPNDIKYIVNTHWHWDHTEGTAAIAAMSGAKTVIGREDAEAARAYFEPDILVSDGDTLALGNTVIRFMHTPGHTRGTVSLFFDAVEDGRSLRVGMFGGAGRNSLVPGKLYYDGCREDYFASLARLRGESVDVMLGNHVWNNDTERKGDHLRETGENLFIDPAMFGRFLDYCESCLRSILLREQNGEG